MKGRNDIQILLPTTSKISVGDIITIKKGVISTRFEKVVEYNTETSRPVVAPTKTLLSVTAHLTGPMEIGACSPLKLSGRKSKGGGGRGLKYHWDVKIASSSYNQSHTTMLSDKLSALTRAASLRLSAEDLQSDTTYNFTLSVSNFLNQRSVEISHLVQKRSVFLPKVRNSQFFLLLVDIKELIWNCDSHPRYHPHLIL